MATAASTLYVTIDASGAQSGGNTVNATLNSIVNQSLIVNNTLIQIGNQASRTTQKMGSDFGSLGKYFRSFQKDLSGVFGLIAAFQPINMFKSYIDELIEVNREYNSFLSMMNVTTKDMNKSKEAYDYVKGAAMSYGVEIKGLLKGYSQLTASTKGLMSELDNKRLFESVAAVTTVMHSTPQTVERIYNSLIQMASKGKVSMEELRQQFGEHVPGALQIGADAMGMTVKKFIEQVAKGGMSASEFLTRLPNELFKRFGEAAELASKSINASLNRLKTTVFDLFKEMSTNSIALGFGAIFDAISNKINQASPAFLTFSEIVGQSALKIAKFIDNLKPSDIQDFFNAITNTASAIATFVSGVIDMIEFMRKYSDELLLAIEILALTRFGVIGLIVPLAEAGAAMVTAGGSAVILGRGLTLVSQAMSLLASFAAGWMFGTYLAEKFEWVEQAGRQMVTGLAAIAEQIEYYFNRTCIEVPKFFVGMFESIINSTNKFIAAISNLGSDALSIIGIDAAKIKPIQFDFTSGYDRELKALESKHSAALTRIAEIDSEMQRDITAKHNKSKTGGTDSKTVAEQLGYDEEKIKRIQARMAELQGLTTNNPYDPKNDPMNGSNGKGKKQRSTLLQDTREGINQLKELYQSYTEFLKLEVESENMTINQAFDAQLKSLSAYTTEQIDIIKEAQSKTKDPETLKSLNDQLLKIEQDFQQSVTKLTRDNIKERVKEQQAADKALIESGALKLSEEAKFLAKWNANEGVMQKNALSGGDTATYDKFELAKQTEINNLRKADRKTVDAFFGTSDDQWLAETTEKYEKMRQLIQNSSAFTVQEQVNLIKRLDSQMEFMTPTVRNIESVITGSFDSMADALADFVQTGKADFGSLIKSMINDMIKLELKANMTKIWSNAGGLSGILGSVAKMFSNTASGTGAGSAAVGSLFGASIDGARALGGPVLAGKSYLVGEKGPEVVTMGGNGNVTPNSALGGINMPVNIYNSVSDSVTATAQPRMNNGNLELDVIIKKTIANDIRSNGPITQSLSNTFNLSRSV